MSESVEVLAEKVRGCLNDRDGMTFNAARRALDTLLARLAEAEKDASSWREVAEVHKTATTAYRRDAEAAEADRDRYKAVVEAADALDPFLDANEVVPERERAALLNALYAIGLGARTGDKACE